MTQEIDIRLIEPNKGQIPGVPANPRVIKDHKYDLLKKSIQDDPEMLQLREVLVFEQEGKFICIGGNMRYRVCKDLGYETIPCKVIPEGTSPEKLKAYTIKDNASFGEWDMDMLANEWDIPDLINWGCDVENFEAQQEPDEAEEDDFDLEEEIPEVAITQPGDIWILGRHRLLCGDATKKDDVAKLMNDRRADMVLTDPPYNVNYEGGTGKKIQNDNMGDSAFFEFLKASFFNMANHLKAGGSYYIWHADSEGLNFRAACKAVGLQVRQCLIWKKNSLVLGRQDYQWIHEPALYGWKDGAAHYFINDRTNTTLWEDQLDVNKMSKDELKKALKEILEGSVPTTIINEDKPSRSAEHPTMKPIKLMGRLIKNSSRKDDIILDLFGGSGSTLIAADQLNRICYTSEIDPIYCDVIVKRWEKQSQKKARRITEEE